VDKENKARQSELATVQRKQDVENGIKNLAAGTADIDSKIPARMNSEAAKIDYSKKRFPGQKSGEVVKLVVRKHWIMDFKIGMILFLIGVIPFLIGILAGDLIWINAKENWFWIFSTFGTLYLLFILLIVYIKWLNEELDIIIVTDERIISHEQIDLFHRQISEAAVKDIQDVKGIENGFFASVLHYGILEIETASSDSFFTMKYVDHPYENARNILDLRTPIK